MPSDSRRHELLRELVRSWAGRGPLRPDWSRGDVDLVWPELVAHRVEVALGSLLPPERLTADQAQALVEARQRSHWQLLELERILPALADAADRPVLLKGAGLALGVYREPAQRWFVDLDLLVPRERLDAACAALERCGYRPFRDRHDWTYYDQYHLHRILVAPTGSVVELHWDLTIPGSPYRFDLGGVRERARPLPVGRRECLVAAPVDLVAHGVYQNLVDGFGDLRRILDLILILPRLDAAAWGQLARILESGRMERGLELTLHIMKSISGVPVPDWRPTQPLGRVAWRLLEGADAVAGCLDRRAAAEAGYNRFLQLVLVPGGPLRLEEFRRLAWPRIQPISGREHRSAAARIGLTALAGLLNATRVAHIAGRALAAPRR